MNKIMPYCTLCGLRKTPRGRSSAMIYMKMCSLWECPGYLEEPTPSSYWPGEADGPDETKRDLPLESEDG